MIDKAAAAMVRMELARVDVMHAIAIDDRGMALADMVVLEAACTDAIEAMTAALSGAATSARAFIEAMESK